jgi:uncharacterized membrane protein YoaK (UPF0700 family)
MSFVIYIIGIAIFMCGVIYGAVLLHIPYQWIIVGSLVIMGLAVLTGVKVTRQKDPPG